MGWGLHTEPATCELFRGFETGHRFLVSDVGLTLACQED